MTIHRLPWKLTTVDRRKIPAPNADAPMQIAPLHPIFETVPSDESVDGGDNRADPYRTLAEAHVAPADRAALKEIYQAVRAITSDLNEPLTAIANYMEASRLLLDRGAADQLVAVRSAVEAAHAQTMRAGQLVNRLRDLTRPEKPMRRTDDRPQR